MRIHLEIRFRVAFGFVCAAMGATAFSAGGANTLHVPADHIEIQSAIGAAQAGDTIIVAPGVYNEAINLLGKAIHLRSSDGPEVTTIDAAGLNTSVITCTSGEGPDTIVEGFTITGGTGTFIDTGSRHGGGMYIIDSSPTVIDCIFTNNAAPGSTGGRGGGVFISNGHPTLIECVFESNFAGFAGGGIDNVSSNPTLLNCVFNGNSSNGFGGGVANFSSHPTLTECIFEGNSAAGGAGMFGVGSSPELTDCDFVNNSAASNGGAMVIASNSHPAIVGCRFTSNSAGSGGGALHIFFASQPTITDSSFESNTAPEGGAILVFEDSDPKIGGTLFCSNSVDSVNGPWTDLGGNIFQNGCLVPGDLTGSGTVGVADLLILLSMWGPCDDCSNCIADLTSDCNVGVPDLIIMLSNWG